jgi:diphosphomevalonate decarboxylase
VIFEVTGPFLIFNQTSSTVSTLAKVFGIEGDVSNIARRGSGSACRSIFGGFVRWHMGEMMSGEDSVATQIVPSNHWPEMRVLILVVNLTIKIKVSCLNFLI